MGIGGTPEGVLSAAALKCVGGAIQGKLWPRTDEERQSLVDDGYDLDQGADDGRPRREPERVLRRHRRHDRSTAARGPLHARGATTDSIVMRSRSGTVRRIEATHAFQKLEEISNLALR